MSAMALWCVIASTHSVPVLEINSQMYHELKDASEGVIIFFHLVSKLHDNAPLAIVYPELVFSTDDTVQCIFEGKGDSTESFSLVSCKSRRQPGKRSKYKISTSNHIMGMNFVEDVWNRHVCPRLHFSDMQTMSQTCLADMSARHADNVPYMAIMSGSWHGHNVWVLHTADIV